MSKLDTQKPSSDTDGQRYNAGQNSYNPSQTDYENRFDKIKAAEEELGDLDNSWNAEYQGKNGSNLKLHGDDVKSNYNADDISANIDKVKEKEQADLAPRIGRSTPANGKPKKRWQLFTSKKLRGKSSLITVALVLFGGGGIMALVSTPTLVIVQLKEVFSQDLNDQVKALDTRSSLMIRAKLKTATTGSCGVVKVACKWGHMTLEQANSLRAAGAQIDLDTTDSPEGRGKPTKISFYDESTKQTVDITSAEDFARQSANNPSFRKIMVKAYNPAYVGTSDRVALGVYKLFKIAKNTGIKGDTDEERRKSLNESIKNGSDEVTTNRLRPETDSEGRPTGDYLDENDQRVTAADRAVIEDTARVGQEASKLGTANVATSVANGLKVTAVAENACTAWIATRAVQGAAKTKMLYDAGRAAQLGLLGPADKSKAGDADEGEMTTVGDMITKTDARKEVPDESKLEQTNASTPPPMIANPDYGKDATDAPGPSVAMHGGAPELDIRASQFMLSGGFVGTMSAMTRLIVKAIPGAKSPQDITRACKTLRNPIVQAGTLAAGVAVGAGSFGLYTAAGIGASLLISMATPYMLSRTVDIMSGNVFQNLSGLNYGDAMFVGTSALLGTMAMKRGMKPLSSKQAVAYANATKQTNDQYATIQRDIAKAAPFDVSNQYSFLGSLTRTVLPYANQSKKSIGSVALNLASFVPASLSFTSSTTKAAATAERFEKCPDSEYQRLNIGADIFCNVRYGLDEEELAIDPIENANWMARTGNIDTESDDGASKDNGQKWNLAKFEKECIEREDGWGEDSADDGVGDGTDCLSAENEAVNKRFRVYKVDQTVSDSLDTKKVDTTPGTTGFSTGEQGPVSSDGWAYPTVVSATTFTQAWKSPTHKGVDIAGPLNTALFAARDGKVVQSGPASGFGNWIVIQHDVDGQRVDTVYGHMYNDGLLVKVGDQVKAGQQIGKMGNNGQSTGSHLHFEIWNGGRFGGKDIDPQPIIEKAKTAPARDRSRDV